MSVSVPYQMLGYLANRLWLGLVTLFGVAVIVFLLMRVLPGDAAVMLSGGEAGSASPEELAHIRANLGLDKPLIIQFAEWGARIARFDLGTSLRTGNPVFHDIANRIPFTFQIILLATFIAVIVGVTLGTLSAVYAGSWQDQLMRAFSIFGIAAPSFWIGLLLILGLVYFFGWRPPLTWDSIWEDPWTRLTQIFCPALAVGLRKMALVSRMARSSMLEVLREDYIRTARAKGLAEWVVIIKHGLRNALMPIVTLVGFEVSALFGGLIVIETVFSIPGLGQYVVMAILNRDYPAAQGTVIILAGIVVLSNLIVDLLYGLLDPRIRI